MLLMFLANSLSSIFLYKLNVYFFSKSALKLEAVSNLARGYGKVCMVFPEDKFLVKIMSVLYSQCVFRKYQD